MGWAELGLGLRLGLSYGWLSWVRVGWVWGCGQSGVWVGVWFGLVWVWVGIGLGFELRSVELS